MLTSWFTFSVVFFNFLPTFSPHTTRRLLASGIPGYPVFLDPPPYCHTNPIHISAVLPGGPNPAGIPEGLTARINYSATPANWIRQWQPKQPGKFEKRLPGQMAWKYWNSRT